MKNRLNKLEKRQKFGELVDLWSSTGPQKMFSSKIKKSSINFNKNLSKDFDVIIEEMKQKENKNAFLSNYFLFEALIYKFGTSNKHQKFWKISLKIYRELRRLLNDDILCYFNKFNEKLKNSQFIYSPLKQTICFFGAILLKKMFKLDKLRLICANSVDCSMGYVELGFFLTFNLMLIAIISDVAKEANKQIIILANIYQKLGNYFYKSSKHCLPPIINFNLFESINKESNKKLYNRDLALIFNEIEGESNRRSELELERLEGLE